MGKAARRKWEARFAQLKAALAAAESKEAPWWESNLLWGGFFGLVLAVVVSAMKEDLRWLLWFAWAFSWPIAWSITKKLSSSRLRNACLTIVILIVGLFLYGLNVALEPRAKQEPGLSKKDLQETVQEAFSRLWKSEPPKQPTRPVLSDPLLHLEPEHGMIWSTGQNQTVGVFLFLLRNTGLEDVDNITVTEEYFVAQRGADIIIKHLGGIPIANPMPTLLKRNDSANVRVDFRKHVEIMNEVTANFNGPSLRGVKVMIKFRRHADGKDFAMTRGYAAIGPHADGLYTEGSEYDSVPQPLKHQFLILSQVTPYFHLREHWTPVTKAISQSPDGRQIVKYY